VTSQETHTQHIVDPDVPDTEVILVEQPAPVFVDSTGRRRRLLRRLAYGFGAFCMVYGGLISLSLAGGPVSPNAVLPFPELIDGGQPTVGEPRPTPEPIVTAPDSVLVNEATPRRGGEAGSWNGPASTRRPAARPQPAVGPATGAATTKPAKPTEVAPSPTKAPTTSPSQTPAPTPAPTPTVSLDTTGGSGGGTGGGTGGGASGEDDGDGTGDDDAEGDQPGDTGSSGDGGGTAEDDCPYAYQDDADALDAVDDAVDPVTYLVDPDSPRAGVALEMTVRLVDLLHDGGLTDGSGQVGVIWSGDPEESSGDGEGTP
jgi:hypothetical protein